MRQKYPIKLIDLRYLVRVSFQLHNGGRLVKDMLSEDSNCGQQNIISRRVNVSSLTVDFYMAQPGVFKSAETGLVCLDRQRAEQILYASVLLVAISLK